MTPGLGLLLWGIDQLRPPKPPPPIILAIARFGGSAEKADAVGNQIEQELDRLQDELKVALGVDKVLRVNGPYSEEIRDPERAEAIAISFGKWHQAHIVIWGDVQTSGSRFRFTVANNSKVTDDSGVANLESGLKEIHPGLAAITERDPTKTATRIKDVAALLLGISYLRIGKDEAAKDCFNKVESDEGHLWRGFLLRRGDAESAQAAIAELEMVSLHPLDAKKLDDDRRRLEGEVSLSLAEALVEAGRFTEALSKYSSARDDYGINTWELENNLGITHYQWAMGGGSDDPKGSLRKSKKAFRRGLRLLEASKSSATDHALILNNYGNALAGLALVFDQGSVERQEWLAKAKGKFEEALKYVTRDSAAEEWAWPQHNLANTLAELGNATPGTAGEDYLQSAKKAYESVLEVHHRDTNPQQYVATERSLGETLYDAGTRPGARDPKQSLDAACAAYRNALKVLGEAGHGQQTNGGLDDSDAQTSIYLARALMALAQLPTTALTAQERVESDEAIRSYNTAIAFYRGNNAFQTQLADVVAERKNARNILGNPSVCH